MTFIYQRPDFSEIKKLSRKKAIRLYCIDCYAGETKGDESPTTCPDFGCPLWRFRMGISPDAAAKRGIEMRGLTGQ